LYIVNINEYVHVKCLRALLYSAADSLGR